MKDKKELFYWYNNKENTFIMAYGEKVIIKGYECFILENDNNTYSIIEGKTGAFITNWKGTEKEAIEDAKNTINMFSEKMERLVKDSIIKIGISPLYKDEPQTV